MKIKYLLPILIFSSIKISNAQDTVIAFNDFQYKIGAKIIGEQSGDLASDYTATYITGSGGIQLIRRFGKTKSSIESGIYLVTKAKENPYVVHQSTSDMSSIPVYFYHLSLPVSYRFDTKIVYLSGGFFIDYLINKSEEKIYDVYKDSIAYYGTDRKLNMGYILTIGLQKSIGKQLSVFAEARLSTTLTSPKLNYRYYFESSYVNKGFAIGVNYKLLRKN